MSKLVKNYNRRKISFKYGKGSFLYSTNGKKYLDFVQGIAVNSLGHAHPDLVKIIKSQAEKLWHVSNLYKIPQQRALADVLVANSVKPFVRPSPLQLIRKKEGMEHAGQLVTTSTCLSAFTVDSVRKLVLLIQ